MAIAKGVIPVYIHPYYADDDVDRDKLMLAAYQKRRDTEIIDHLASNAPLVIFEESCLTDPFQPTHPPLPECVRGANEGTLYVVKGDPRPVDGSWEDVGRILFKASVKQIQLCGSLLRYACVEMSAQALTEQNLIFLSLSRYFLQPHQ